MSVSGKIAAVVLAAGRSARMGPHNKLLERIAGETIIAHVVGVVIASGAAPVIVVTGFESHRIEEVLRDLGITFVHNPVLWGASYFAEMKQIGGDRGAKGLIAKYAQRVVEVPVESEGIFADVDTPEDLARLKAKRGTKS